MTAASPRRILRRRSKGWRMPAGAIYVGRPGRYGNPFDWIMFGRAAAVDFYKRWLAGELTAAERAAIGVEIMPLDLERQRRRILEGVPELRGKDLACWCPPGEPCHADVLLELANR